MVFYPSFLFAFEIFKYLLRRVTEAAERKRVFGHELVGNDSKKQSSEIVVTAVNVVDSNRLFHLSDLRQNEHLEKLILCTDPVGKDGKAVRAVFK